MSSVPPNSRCNGRAASAAPDCQLRVRERRRPSSRRHCSSSLPAASRSGDRTHGQARLGRFVRIQGRALPPVTLLVDISVWSLDLRRDASASEPEVHLLRDALVGADVVVTTGLVLHELLQGFSGPKSHAQIVERFGASQRFHWYSPIAKITAQPPTSATGAAEQAFRSARSTRCLLSCAFDTI